MFRSWRIGTVFGIGLYIHWSFWLLPLLAFWQTQGEQGVAEGLLFAAFLLTLFACVLLHELGHALMAREVGIPTKDITLYPIGGVARLERISENPWEEIGIALAGPAVNVVIAVIVGTLLAVSGQSLALVPIGFAPASEHFFNWLLWGNIALVIFNLIPAFPLDGGRVFRAALALLMGRLAATQVAATVGTLLALLLGLAGLLAAQPLTVIVALFVALVGQVELAQVRMMEQQRYQRWEASWLTPPSSQFSGYVWDNQRGLWIEYHNGRPIGEYHPGPR